MVRFYDYFLMFYALVAIVVWILYLRGNYIFPQEVYHYIFIASLPFFFFLTGIAIGYILGYLWILKNDIEDTNFINKVYIKANIVGSVIWVLLASIYIYLLNYN